MRNLYVCGGHAQSHFNVTFKAFLSNALEVASYNLQVAECH